jgi:hypothetical protein
MKWAGHVWGRRDFETAFWPENLREVGHFESVVVDGSILLKWFFNK